MLVKQTTDTEGFGDDGLLKTHLFVLFTLEGRMQGSGDHTLSLDAAFRITSDYGR